MPNVVCASCGHEFKAVRCQCKGHILSAESWKLGRWDWRPVYGSFSDRVRPMDIDFLVERNGKFLLFETKAPGVPIEAGQRRALEAISRIPQFTVAAIWGEPDEAAAISHLSRGQWSPQESVNNSALWDFCARWWTEIANRRYSA